MKYLLTYSLIWMTGMIYGQKSIKVEVSADTVVAGQLVEVTYTIENGEGKFDGPDLHDLPLMSGPNVSSSFMIQNGSKSSSQSYTYIFKPNKEEVIHVPQAFYHENGKTQTIEPITITVVSTLDDWVNEQRQSLKPIREKKKI
ncbi:MAG TPA: BatD family protein [Saprospiraceae bacterium]|nr:BatD family protein [Saprospiraceae bacterium]